MQSKILELFSSNEIDCAAFFTFESVHDPQFYYFSQISEPQSNCAIVLRKGKKPIVLCGPLEYGNLKGKRQFQTIEFKSSKERVDSLKKLLNGKKVGICENFLPLGAFKPLKKILSKSKFLDVTASLGLLRETKTTEELKKISNAVRITQEIIDRVPEFTKVGMKEFELAAELEHSGRRMGASSLSFPTIVGFGKNSAVPHHSTGNTKLKKGDLVLADFGLKAGGYCADLTRTFVFGKSTQKQQEVYDIVFEAKERATKIVREGMPSSDVYNAANDYIKEKFGSDMIHSIGHGLGLEVHDFPNRMWKVGGCNLAENMCVTIEPGYYDPSWGGVRIEDDILVKKNGFKRLSRAPKDLIIL